MKLPEPGDRIRLLVMPHDPAPIERGTEGTVTKVVKLSIMGDNGHQIQVAWDNGRGLALSVPPDRYAIIERKE